MRKPVGSPPAGADSPAVETKATQEIAPSDSPRLGWGGKRKGAGRPSKAKQKERAQQTAELVLCELQAPADLKETLQELLNVYRTRLAAEHAKGPAGSKRHIIELGQGIRGVIEQMNQLEKAVPHAHQRAPATISAPAVEQDADTWRAKYANPQKPEESRASPAIEQLNVSGEKPADAPAKPRLTRDNDTPPVRAQTLEPGPYLTGLGPHEFGELSPEQIADLERR